MEVVREGRIIIHLEQGKVELKAPQLEGITKARERNVELLGQEERIQAKLNALYEEVRKEHEEAAKAQLRSLDQVGQGAVRLTRAFVILGASGSESLDQLVRGIFYMQAAWDLVSGSITIIRSLAQAQRALAAANLTLMATFTPLALILGTVATALIVLATALAFWRDSQRKAKEEAEQFRDATDSAAESYYNWLTITANRTNERGRLLFDADSPERQQADIDRRINEANRAGNRVTESARIGGLSPREEIAYLSAERELAEAGAAAVRERIDLERQRVAAEESRIDREIRTIENQQRSIELAQRQLDVEREKIRAFQAQVGALSAVEQQQLKDIRDKLRAGQDINELEEQFLAERGGEQGRNIADFRRAQRAEAAGFGADFFEGIEGAGTGLKDAAKSLEDAVAALEQLTLGLGAAEAVARLEEEKRALQEQYREFYAGQIQELERLVGIVEIIDNRLRTLEQAVINSGGRQ